MRMLTLGLVLTTSLLACSDKEVDEDDDGGGDDTAAGSTDIVPTTGPWTSDEGTVVEDSCNFDDGGEDTGEPDEEPAVLTMGEGDTFTVQFPGEGPLVDCTLTPATGDYTCESQTESTDFAEYELDAVVTYLQSFWGSFSSATSGTMSLQIDASCEGEDCATVESYAEITLPCTTQVLFQITYGE